jgi:hypothetical protein
MKSDEWERLTPALFPQFCSHDMVTICAGIHALGTLTSCESPTFSKSRNLVMVVISCHSITCPASHTDMNVTVLAVKPSSTARILRVNADASATCFGEYLILRLNSSC